MSGDLVQLAGEITPYVVAAAGTYGGAVLVRAQEEAADATVGFGRRLAQRFFGVGEEGQEVPEVLADVIEDPEDADSQAALRKAIRKALAADEGLAAQVEQWVSQARSARVPVMAFGERSAAVQTNRGIIATGDGNTFPQ